MGKYGQWCYGIALKFSKELDSTDCSVQVFERLIRFLKWRDEINSNSWFLATLKEFSEGFFFFQADIFFLKLK